MIAKGKLSQIDLIGPFLGITALTLTVIILSYTEHKKSSILPNIYALHKCRKTKTFIENVCYYWFDQYDVDINEDVLSVIIKYGLSNDMKQNIKRCKFDEKKFIELKVVIEGGDDVGKTCFANYLELPVDERKKRSSRHVGKSMKHVNAEFDDVSVSIDIHENHAHALW